MTPEEVRDIARTSGFVKRRSKKLDPYEFLMALVFRGVSTTAVSLGLFTVILNCVITRPGLHLRFGKTAEAFFKQCLQKIILKRLAKSINHKISLLEPFERALIIDSSSWQVPEHLQWVFPGAGGSGSSASIKVQFMYDYISGEFVILEETKGTDNDQKYSSTIGNYIRKADLLLADLGYWAVKNLWSIAEAGAYFISRMNTQQMVYIEADGRMNRVDIVDLLSHTTQNAIEIQVYLKHKKNYLPVHFTAWRVPEEIASQRRRRAKADARRKGRGTPSQRRLTLCDWSIFVTNAPREILPGRMIRTLYRLRWNIELIFKSWKSVIHKHVTTVRENPSRLLCELYAKMILAVIVHRLHTHLHNAIWLINKRELSLDKLWKFIEEHKETLHQALLDGVDKFTAFLNQAIPLIIEGCEKLHQPSRKTTLQMLDEKIGDIQPEPLAEGAINAVCSKLLSS